MSVWTCGGDLPPAELIDKGTWSKAAGSAAPSSYQVQARAGQAKAKSIGKTSATKFVWKKAKQATK